MSKEPDRQPGRGVHRAYFPNPDSYCAPATARGAPPGPPPQLRERLDVFVSHDWPQWITKYGDAAALFRKKPYFKAEVRRGARARGGGGKTAG
jgi:hypothetical protein